VRHILSRVLSLPKLALSTVEGGGAKACIEGCAEKWDSTSRVGLPR